MNNLLKTLIIFCLLSPLEILSSGNHDIRFNKLSSYEHPSPKAITKDKFGFLWIGTRDGLLKYDGYTYKKYVNDFGNSSSISSGNIRSLLLDSKGRLWVATANQLNQYNYTTDSFKNYNFGSDKQNFIYEVFEASDNSIWVASRDGIKRLNENEKFESFEYYQNSSGGSAKIGRARTFYQDIDDTLWIGTFESGVLRFDFSKETLFQLPSDKLSEMLIVGISEYSDNYLLVGSNNTGVHVISKRDGSENTKESFNIILSESQLRDVKVKEVMTDSAGIHWIGTEANGLLIIEENNIRQFKEDASDSKSLPENRVNDIYEDDQGNMWISNLTNIAIYNPSNKNITTYYSSND